MNNLFGDTSAYSCLCNQGFFKIHYILSGTFMQFFLILIIDQDLASNYPHFFWDREFENC